MVGLVSVDVGVAWRLGIRNTNAVNRDFAWVVADRRADTVQPWSTPRPPTTPVTATILIGTGAATPG
jgi:hypothetical protein